MHSIMDTAPSADRQRCFIILLLFIISGLILGLTSSGAAARVITFNDFISLGRVYNPQVSPDGKKVIFEVVYYDKAANQGNSDIYMASLEGEEDAVRLTQSPEGDSQASFSPDGKMITFISSRSGEPQIWLLPVSGGEARQLTHLSTGASGPVWAPDGSSILFTSRVYPDCPDDSSNAARMEQEKNDKCRARVITSLMYRHWNHWIGERRKHLFIIPIAGGEPRDLTPGTANVPTIALGSGHDYAMSPDCSEISVVANTSDMRAANTNNDIFIIALNDLAAAPRGPGDFPSGWTRLTANTANDNYPVYSPNGRFIIYRAMKRAGFEADQYRLTLYDRTRKTFADIGADLADKMDRSARSIAWAPDGKKIYATCQDGAYVSVYEINVNSRRVRQLTSKIYISSLRMTPGSAKFVFLKQTAAAPYEVFSADRSFRAKSFRNLSKINTTSLAALDMEQLQEFDFEGAGGAKVNGLILKPPGFREGRKYPLIFLIHGGPQGAWSDSFHWRWNYQMFAAPGYVVAAVNPRGSTGYGQVFTDEISRDWGGKVFEDLIKGQEFILDNYGAFIDENRIAAAGASYGGYMVNWIEGHMESFKKPFRCLVNHDGVYNLTSMYGATEELWFPEWDLGGTPWENPEGYAEFSPHTYAANFHTPMLIVHGQLDYRVPLAEGMQVFTTLKRQEVPAKLLYFPDEGHWVQKPQNAELWWETVHEWLHEWLK